MEKCVVRNAVNGGGRDHGRSETCGRYDLTNATCVERFMVEGAPRLAASTTPTSRNAVVTDTEPVSGEGDERGARGNGPRGYTSSVSRRC